MTSVAGVMSLRPSAAARSKAAQVDERLEDRARLSLRRDRTVELRLVVRAAADEREHLAGAGIDRDESGLGLPLALAARENLVDAHDPVAHDVLRDALQVDVERRVDVERVGHAGQVRQLLGERLADQVHEVRRLRLERALHHLHRLGAHAGGGVLRDEAGFRHRPQHDVATLARPLGRVERRPHGG